MLLPKGEGCKNRLARVEAHRIAFSFDIFGKGVSDVYAGIHTIDSSSIVMTITFQLTRLDRSSQKFECNTHV